MHVFLKCDFDEVYFFLESQQNVSREELNQISQHGRFIVFVSKCNE